MAQRSSIVGSIVERKPISSSSSGPKLPALSAKTGFPTVQHRSKSAFSRTREEGRRLGPSESATSSRPRDVPIVAPTHESAPSVSNDKATFSSPPPGLDPGDWRDQISKENEERVASMDEAEREEERKQILNRFGSNIGDVLRRARLARETQKQPGKSPGIIDSKEDAVPITFEDRKPTERARSPPPSALVTPSSTRPSSRADRRLRFAELEADDVHVYESAPTTPKRRVLALPPPDSLSDGDAISLGQWKGKMVPQNSGMEISPAEDLPVQHSTELKPAGERKDPDEGTSEYIRRRYFPNAPRDDPNLEWMNSNPDFSLHDSTSTSLRFDLQGNPIPPSISLTLPTHLGLHHHAEGAHAGYTLDDIFLLSRSTVPAQRAAMLNILARIAQRLAAATRGNATGMEEVIGKEDELRKRIVAAGVEAMSERGSVGARAIEVVWECIVGWNPDLTELESVELQSSDSVINTLSLDFLLPQISVILSQGAAVWESQVQLLSILHRLAQQSNAIANSLVSTPKLLLSVLHTFLLTPMPAQDLSPLPDPLVLQFFFTLVASSRANAEEIEKIANSFLRFITFLPSSSPYPELLTANLITWTLQVYRALALYGFYSHIAGGAVTPLTQLEQYIISETCTSRSLKVAWSNLIEVWMTCATDPHQTTPEHDIRWSQVVGWSWDAGLLELQSHLGVGETEWTTWAATWKAQAAWLEGSKVNAVKGGDAERASFVESVKPLFEGGRAAEVIGGSLGILEKSLLSLEKGNAAELKVLSGHASVLGSVIRLWLACLPPHQDGPPPSPPFTLPFARLSQLTADLLVHPLWLALTSPDGSFSYLWSKEFSNFLVLYLKLSRRLPGVSESLWMAQAFSIILRLGPGDEDAAEVVLEDAKKIITPEWAAVRGIQLPVIIWERGGLAILEPFFAHKLRPLTEVCIGPTIPSPKSIKTTTTQRLPSLVGMKQLGLPLYSDWTMTPIDHLLRSADSAVFKVLPISWDSSEVEVTRAALLLTKIVQEALLNISITPLVLTREEAVFRCMQVFMLEHGQSQNDSANEVFRDGVVERLMEDILQVYAYGSSPRFPSKTRPEKEDLEKVAARFLGASTPFFQFYTDFVALYDASSFSHPLFANLLLAPTSMHYAKDYRKHLWCDFGHVIKTIRTAPGRILSADVGEYLYPIEEEPQILSAYLGALLKDDVHEFPRLVALHHVASNIWPDLHGLGKAKDERAGAMLKAVVLRGSHNVFREIVRYNPTSKALLPPACFESMTDEVVALRMDCVVRWGGSDMLNRVEGLLKFSEVS